MKRLAFLLVLLLASCQNSATTTTGPAPGWFIDNTFVNAQNLDFQTGQARQVVFFSQLPWQSTSPRQPYFAHGWVNDVLAGNPYSFQLGVNGGQFLTDGLRVREPGVLDPSTGKGRILQSFPPRVNLGENCGPNGRRATPGVVSPPRDASIQCFWDPGQAQFISRPTLPLDRASYSVELAASCRGSLQYINMSCPPDQVDTKTVLTLSPPRVPSMPQHGQKFEYELVSGTGTRETATKFTAVYVQPGLCTIDNLLAPVNAKAGDQINVQWFVRNCNRIQVSVDDPNQTILHYEGLQDPMLASVPTFNSSRPYLVPARDRVTITLEARDALGQVTKRTVQVNVDPCSISKTHPRCPTRCQAEPAPRDCPQPPAPQCPVGQGDENRQSKNYTFEVLCSLGGGLAERRLESSPGCTEAAARQSVNNRLTLGCAVVKIVGPAAPDPTEGMTPVPECMGGAMKRNWEFCLRCSSQNGPISNTQTVNACFLNDAVEKAKLNYPTQACWLQNQGRCP